MESVSTLTTGHVARRLNTPQVRESFLDIHRVVFAEKERQNSVPRACVKTRRSAEIGARDFDRRVPVALFGAARGGAHGGGDGARARLRRAPRLVVGVSSREYILDFI